MHPPVDRFNADEWQNARRVIASLTSKSAKAQQKLAPGTWQHKMLGDNLKALHIASALIDDRVADMNASGPNDLQEALRVFATMRTRADKAKAAFLPGSSQHTLQKNRRKALRMAEALTKSQLAKRKA